MPLVKGSFELKWGDNVLTDIEEIEVDYEVDSEDFETVDGRSYELEGSHRAAVNLTLLASDIPALSAVLPQYHVANGGVLSTGETVNNADGAIDVNRASCDSDPVYNNLDIISCANPGEVFRLVNARTRIEGIDIDNKVRRVVVRFIGEPETDEATIQFFKEGTIAVVS